MKSIYRAIILLDTKFEQYSSIFSLTFISITEMYINRIFHCHQGILNNIVEYFMAAAMNCTTA
jgi:hypothetical protein